MYLPEVSLKIVQYANFIYRPGKFDRRRTHSEVIKLQDFLLQSFSRFAVHLQNARQCDVSILTMVQAINSGTTMPTINVAVSI